MYTNIHAQASSSSSIPFVDKFSSTSSRIKSIGLGVRIFRKGVLTSEANSDQGTIKHYEDTETLSESALVVRFAADEIQKDIILRFAPIRKYAIQVEIGSIIKAEPKVVIPDWARDDTEV